MGYEHLYKTITVKNWDEAKEQLANTPAHWVFRGQRTSDWDLVTSLERSTSKAIANLNAMGASESLGSFEERSLDWFQRKAKHFVSGQALPTDRMEWFALMQHHGAPTRILDWTESPYVAAYFALENAEGPCAVWATDASWLFHEGESALLRSGHNLTKIAKSDPDYTEAIFSNSYPGVFVAEPFNMNQRLIMQQGLFLCSGDLSMSFMDNLDSMKALGINQRLMKIVIPATERSRALYDLLLMNIHRETLFPGLDGFAQSIHYQIAQFEDPQVVKNFYPMLLP